MLLDVDRCGLATETSDKSGANVSACARYMPIAVGEIHLNCSPWPSLLKQRSSGEKLTHLQPLVVVAVVGAFTVSVALA